MAAVKRRFNTFCHQACENCKKGHLKCDGVMPCSRCAKLNLECVFSTNRRRGPKPKMGKMDCENDEDVPVQQNVQQLLLLNNKIQEELEQQKRATSDWEKKFRQLEMQLVHKGQPNFLDNKFVASLQSITLLTAWMQAFHVHHHPRYHGYLQVPSTTEIQAMFLSDQVSTSLTYRAKKFRLLTMLAYGAHFCKNFGESQKFFRDAALMFEDELGFPCVDVIFGLLLLSDLYFFTAKLVKAVFYREVAYRLADELYRKTNSHRRKRIMLLSTPIEKIVPEETIVAFLKIRALSEKVGITRDPQEIAVLFKKAEEHLSRHPSPKDEAYMIFHRVKYHLCLPSNNEVESSNTELQTPVWDFPSVSNDLLRLQNLQEEMRSMMVSDPEKVKFYRRYFHSSQLALISLWALARWKEGNYQDALTFADKVGVLLDDTENIDLYCPATSVALSFVSLVYKNSNNMAGLNKIRGRLQQASEIFPLIKIIVQQLEDHPAISLTWLTDLFNAMQMSSPGEVIQADEIDVLWSFEPLPSSVETVRTKSLPTCLPSSPSPQLCPFDSPKFSNTSFNETGVVIGSPIPTVPTTPAVPITFDFFSPGGFSSDIFSTSSSPSSSPSSPSPSSPSPSSPSPNQSASPSPPSSPSSPGLQFPTSDISFLFGVSSHFPFQQQPQSQLHSSQSQQTLKQSQNLTFERSEDIVGFLRSSCELDKSSPLDYSDSILDLSLPNELLDSFHSNLTSPFFFGGNS